MIIESANQTLDKISLDDFWFDSTDKIEAKLGTEGFLEFDVVIPAPTQFNDDFQTQKITTTNEILLGIFKIANRFYKNL